METLLDAEHAVQRAHVVLHPLFALGVDSPRAVDDELVFIRAGGEEQNGLVEAGSGLSAALAVGSQPLKSCATSTELPGSARTAR